MQDSISIGGLAIGAGQYKHWWAGPTVQDSISIGGLTIGAGQYKHWLAGCNCRVPTVFVGWLDPHGTNSICGLASGTEFGQYCSTDLIQGNNKLDEISAVQVW